MESVEDVSNKNSNYECPICQSYNVEKIYSNYPGYVDGTSYDIFKCNNCITEFILAPGTSEEVYNAIYNLQCVPAYDRYKKYAKSLIYEKEPFKFLSKQEFAYEAVYNYLNDKKEKVKSILEVGTGLGYLTYALNKTGYSTLGIDISETSVRNAINLFGSFYKAISLEKLSSSSQQKFDLIVMTEVIEHVNNPLGLISGCLPLLNETGVILLTTPHYYNVNKVWETELPPVHRFWFSKKSFQTISKSLGLKVDFIFPDKGCFNFNHSNLLVNFIIDKHFSNKLPKLPTSTLTSDLRGCVETNYHIGFFKSTMKRVATSKTVCYLSNMFYFKFIHKKEEGCFAIILKK